MSRGRWARHQLRNVSQSPSTGSEESPHIRAARRESLRISHDCSRNSGPSGTRSAGESKTIGRKPAWISLAGYAEVERLGREKGGLSKKANEDSGSRETSMPRF